GRRHARDRYCRNRRYPRRRAVTARRAIPPDDRSYAPAAPAAFRRPPETALLRRARRRFPRMLAWRRTTITPLTPRRRRASQPQRDECMPIDPFRTLPIVLASPSIAARRRCRRTPITKR